MNAVKLTKPPTPSASTRPEGMAPRWNRGAAVPSFSVVPHPARRQQRQRRRERGERSGGQQARRRSDRARSPISPITGPIPRPPNTATEK